MQSKLGKYLHREKTFVLSAQAIKIQKSSLTNASWILLPYTLYVSNFGSQNRYIYVCKLNPLINAHLIVSHIVTFLKTCRESWCRSDLDV